MNRLFGDRRERTGLALSGGGARGLAHAGALKAMTEMGIKPDILAGTSAGSIAAVMYAAGLTPEHMLELFTDTSLRNFVQLAVPRNGFFKMDGFKRFLRKAIPYENLEDLPIPTRVVATDIDRGRTVVFESGPIVDCVCASCAIPIVFQPVKIGGVSYVDGGVLKNLPASVIRDKCKVLFGINVSPLIHDAFKNSILDIAQRSYTLLARHNAIPDRELCDLLVETPEIAHYRAFNLSGIKRVYNSGYRLTRKALIDAGFRPLKR